MFIRRLITCLSLALCAGTALRSPALIVPSSPTTEWTAIPYPAGSPTIPDPAGDQQTGSKEADIIGNAAHPSFYSKFFDGGTPSLTDGQVAFRLRLAEETNPPGFSGAAFVGIDGNGDAALDLFVGVNNSGSSPHVGIWRAGSGANISPSTTTIVTPPLFSYSQTTANYAWTVVNQVIDPPALTLDLDNGGGPDRFLSFLVPFTDLVSAMAIVGISGFNQDTLVTFVAATATQANALNQDLNGVSGGLNSSSTWAALGALTYPTSSSLEPIPEPASLAIITLALGHWLVLRRRNCP